MRLYVRELAAEQPGYTLDRDPLDEVDILAAAVIALARKSFGIFVGQHRALRFQNRARDDVFGSNQLDLVTLTPQLEFDRVVDFGIYSIQGSREEGLDFACAFGARRRRHSQSPGAASGRPRQTTKVRGWAAIPYRPRPAKHWAVEGSQAQYLGIGGPEQKETPARRPGLESIHPQWNLEPVKDLVGPEPLEPVQ